MQHHFTNSFTKPIITIYCLCDDFLRAWGHQDAPQAKTSTAEVMTVALVAAALFNGNQERSRRFLKEHGYIKTMLSKSRFNRRLPSSCSESYNADRVCWIGVAQCLFIRLSCSLKWTKM